MKHGCRITTAQTGRRGVFAPAWSVLLVVLFYGAQLGPDLLDGLIHLQHQATRHPASTHYEDPGKQSHSDSCLVSHARGELRASPSFGDNPLQSAPATQASIPAAGEPVALDLPSTLHARAPPVLAA